MSTNDHYLPKKHVKGDRPDKFFAKPERPKAERPERDGETRERSRYSDDRKPKRNFDKPVRRADVAKADSERANAGMKKEEVMPLNKFVAHCGICSRREAVELVKQGLIKVNGEVKTEPGYKVQPTDKIEYNGKPITSKKNLVYILLNKPKNYITTTDDPQERRTVMDLVADAGDERVYPIGRLDRNTTGLLLLTNDGELAQKLSHPKYNIKKVYQVTLDKNLGKPDFEKILAGLTLEDGEVKVDALAYLEKKNEIGIEIHSGRNRIVRRIFESLGYAVEKLDRVMYAGLTKKNIPRAKWRFLNEKEIINLKHFKQ
ncbi:MAG: rRNA pseudouridine synthase [Chitinophagaceae bacterium]|nr:rRNA pseudouridine synthase [Chitinophagaceae bacterium]